MLEFVWLLFPPHWFNQLVLLQSVANDSDVLLCCGSQEDIQLYGPCARDKAAASFDFGGK